MEFEHYILLLYYCSMIIELIYSFLLHLSHIIKSKNGYIYTVRYIFFNKFNNTIKKKIRFLRIVPFDV